MEGTALAKWASLVLLAVLFIPVQVQHAGWIYDYIT